MPNSDKQNTTKENTEDFFNEQLEEWALFNDNYEIFNEAPYEKLFFDSIFWEASKTLLNYRKASLTADIEAIERGERPCFLCRQARPKEQRAIEWKDYEILVNPYPASSVHFTIACKEHAPQLLGDRIVDMAKMTRIFYECCIFYNGARCGASAPDHLHFQAVDEYDARNFMLSDKYLIQGHKIGSGRVFIPRPNMCAYGYIIIETKKDSEILPIYKRVLECLPDSDGPEPMMNVVAIKLRNTTRIVIIPRKRHRPSCYGQMLVSPASLEMMGSFITSRQEDFDILDENTMRRIYNEVGYTYDEFYELIKELMP